jgi:serine/threonine-protein kinase
VEGLNVPVFDWVSSEEPTDVDPDLWPRHVETRRGGRLPRMAFAALIAVATVQAPLFRTDSQPGRAPNLPAVPERLGATLAAPAADAIAPLGLLHVDADPWAEIWIDGSKVGETPLGNIPLRIGSHQVTLRHPQLGERRQTASVTADGPNNISVDMNER